MNVIVYYKNIEVGMLSDESGNIFFEYTPDFINTGINLSPYHLPLETGLHSNHNVDFSFLHGLFYDNLPDNFGESVIREKYGDSLSPLEKLCLIADRGIGAITYKPDLNKEKYDSNFIDLIDAVNFSRSLIKEKPINDLTKEFVASAISAGGAMPKLLGYISNDLKTVYRNGAKVKNAFPYLIKLDVGVSKFKSQSTKIEYVYNKMANKAGINVVNAKLLESCSDNRTVFHLALPRYDREGNNKLHIHSYAGLRHLYFKDPSHSYDLLFRTVRGLTRNQSEVDQAFKRMIFNYISVNQDDHVKNHSFMMNDSGDWHLTPAYDLTFMYNPSLNGSFMSIDGKRKNINTAHLISFGLKHGISKNKVKEQIDECKTSINGFMTLSNEVGITKNISKYINAKIENKMAEI
tara:strand:+ start:1138 stop:2355 length:1218 start_codon:yes stop_codon:yes gene_type:complete